jgi:TolA-binding protein
MATPGTNAVAIVGTNVAATPATNAAPAQTNAPAPSAQASKTAAPAPDVNSKRSAMITYLAAFVGAANGLGLLIANDVSHFMGAQAIEFLFNDIPEGQRDPEYERAEAEWANGKHLDAIQMMRDFLKRHPRELYAALRIAEIYEKDLRNYLAAALEYEEVLKHRLPAERWGWAAVHLCNLYYRINQPDKALALLRRVAGEYPKTAAAKKARARLGIAEPEPEAPKAEAVIEAEPESSGEQPVIVMEEHPPELEPRTEAPPPPPPPPTPPEPPKPSLPPGFRPKK